MATTRANTLRREDAVVRPARLPAQTRPAPGAKQAILQTFDAKLGKAGRIGYAKELHAALPRAVLAREDETRWKAALIGPARSPTGYRDAVVLIAGRLVSIVVRQRHRDGNIRTDAAAEISRVVQAQAANVNRARRRLIPDVVIGPDWLRTAARQRNIPLSGELAQDLVGQLHSMAQAEKAAFRRVLIPEVAELLPDDEGLSRFYAWMADEAIAAENLGHRRAAYRRIGAAVQHVMTGEAGASVDRGADALIVLSDRLAADPDAVDKLLQRRPEIFEDFDDAQRKAWALDLMSPAILKAIGDDLDEAGGWAGRAMSVAAVASADRGERRLIAKSLIERRPLRKFGPKHKAFARWPFDEGCRQFADVIDTTLRYGILPGVMIDPRRPTPSAAEITKATARLAFLVGNKLGIMAVDAARRRWAKLREWLPKNAAAACHPGRTAWPAAVGDFKTDKSLIRCVSSEQQLGALASVLSTWPTALHDAVVGEKHLLVLRDAENAIVAVTAIDQSELEAVRADSRISAANITREGWASTPQWRRWMRTDVAQLLQHIATGKLPCDVEQLRQSHADRAAALQAIAAMPCRFDAEHDEARSLVAEILSPIMGLLVHQPGKIVDELFGAMLDDSLLGDAAFLAVEQVVEAVAQAAPRENSTISSLLRPRQKDATELIDVEAAATEKKGRGKKTAGQHLPYPTSPETTRFLVLDVETTGLDDDDRIVELAVIEMIGAKPTGRTLHTHINPMKPVSPGAFAIHGISDDDLAKAQKFSQIVGGLLDLIGDDEVWFVGHNVAFDIGKLLAEFRRIGVVHFDITRTLCTMAMSSQTLGARSLDAACDRLGIDRSSRTKHGAMTDAELTVSVFRKLMFGESQLASSAH